jgi:multiple sugar transport system substrate-binding protein
MDGFDIMAQHLWRMQAFNVVKRVYLTVSLAIVLGFLSFTFLLSGCEATPTPPPTPQPTATATSRITLNPTASPTHTPTVTPTPAPISALGVTEEELRGLQINFWHISDGPAEELIVDFIEEFNNTNEWGIKVNPRQLSGPGVIDDAFQAALVDDNLPDVLVGRTEQGLRWDIGGALLVDLLTYREDPLWGMPVESQQDFFPDIWDGEYIQRSLGSSEPIKKFLGLPWYRSGVVLLYNQTWAKELGYNQPPITPDELSKQACAAAAATKAGGDVEKEGKGGWMVTPSTSLLLTWLYAFGAEVQLPDQSGYQFDTPEAIQAFSLLAEMKDQDCAWFTDSPEPYLDFADRKALFFVVPLSGLEAQVTAFTQAGSQDSWLAMGFPVDQGKELITVYGPSLMIVRSTPQEELASWLFIRWLVRPENQARWTSTTGFFPTRISVAEQIGAQVTQPPQWKQALSLLPGARVEPAYISWTAVRWTLQDVLGQIFSQNFAASQVGQLAQELDALTAEIHAQVR